VKRSGYEWTDSINPKARAIHLRSPETDKEENHLVEDFLGGMLSLERAGRGEITVLMHHYGGSVYSGLAIYDAIRYSKCRTKLFVYGACMSMGVCILQAATRRIMMPNATLMLHSGATTLEADHNIELKAEIQEGQRLDQLYEEIIAKRSRIVPKKLTEMCNKKTYLTARQAVQMGLADLVYSGKKP
jgi:ATP-dependent Clp protease protease subunit